MHIAYNRQARLKPGLSIIGYKYATFLSKHAKILSKKIKNSSKLLRFGDYFVYLQAE